MSLYQISQSCLSPSCCMTTVIAFLITLAHALWCALVATAMGGVYFFLLNYHVYIASYDTDIINVLLSEATSERGKVHV